MKIERIELENWMSYPRRWAPADPSGGSEPAAPALTFSGQPLVLISGDNGSGKSAILEAICYALFGKYPRGNNQDAIRSGEAAARICLDFSLPTHDGDAVYRVERILSNRAGGNSALLSQCQPGGAVIPLETGQSAVTEYIVQKLLRGVEYDAFVSTVFLRQEAAGKFMELPHSEQRAQLLRLCQLDIYGRIYEQAQKLRKAQTAALADAQGQFAQVGYATGAYLEQRREDARYLDARRTRLRREEQQARQLLEKIQRAVQLTAEIASGKTRLGQWQAILQDAKAIRHAAQWQNAWSRVHNTLAQSAVLAGGIANRAGTIDRAQGSLAAASAAALDASRDLDSCEADKQQAQEAFNQASDSLLATNKDCSSAQAAHAYAVNAKRLDDAITAIQAEQERREQELRQYDEVKQQKALYDLLVQARGALQFVLQRQAEAASDLAAAQTKETQAKAAKAEAARAEELAAQQGQQIVELESQAASLDREERELHRQIDSALDIIANRNRALAAGVCPTCGTEISGDIGAHVCQDITELDANLAAANARLEPLVNELRAKREESARLRSSVMEANRQRDASDNRAAELAESAAEARDNAARRRQQAASEWASHTNSWHIPLPSWLQEPSPQAQQTLTAELAQLDGVEQRYRALTELNATFKSEARNLDKARKERAGYDLDSPVSEAQVADLRSKYQLLASRVKQQEQAKDALAKQVKEKSQRVQDAAQIAKEAESQRSALERELTSLRAVQAQDTTHLGENRQFLAAELAQLGAAFPDLADGLGKAVDVPEAYQALE
ncbi:MAG: AAA family ATPase, partial [Anaerolineae bacterium]